MNSCSNMEPADGNHFLATPVGLPAWAFHSWQWGRPLLPFHFGRPSPIARLISHTRRGRVAGWRADQGRINQPGHGSTPPPINRTAGFPQSGWKSRHSVAAFPTLPSLCLGERLVCCNLQRRSGSGRQLECIISTPTLSFSNACLLPEALCSDGLLSPPSLLLRPHAPVYRSPPHFPVVAGYSVGLMNERPSPL